MSSNKVSVIIPIYNAEKYLKECIKSVQDQTLKDIEIICINDGSIDKSLEIINYFAKNDSRIKVIDKKNEGVWKARMDGIKYSNGDFITFLDSDDTIEENFIEKLYLSITTNNSDIAVCGFKRIDAINNRILSSEMKYSSKRIIDENNFEDVISINTALWNKIYKASLLKKMKTLENPPRILEDMMFLNIVYLNVKKISFVDDYLYNYYIRNGSSMNTLKENEIEKIRKPMIELKEMYVSNGCDCNKMEILSSIAFLHFGVSLMLRIYQDNNYNYKKEYKENLEFLNNNFKEWKKTKYLSISYSLFSNKANLKLAIIRKIYKLHLFRLFLFIYKILTKTLKIDIKW